MAIEHIKANVNDISNWKKRYLLLAIFKNEPGGHISYSYLF